MNLSEKQGRPLPHVCCCQSGYGPGSYRDLLGLFAPVPPRLRTFSEPPSAELRARDKVAEVAVANPLDKMQP